MTRLNVIAPRQGVDLGAGSGAAFGSFGELLQGVLPDDDVDFLVTFPIDRGSRVRFRLDPGGELHVFPSHKWKARTLARMLMDASGWDGGGTLVVDSELPVGKGLASSSADLVATARALGEALGIEMPPSAIEDWLRPIEPTDGVMYPGVVAFEHRRVRLRALLGPLPPVTVVAVDEGGQVDTVAFNASRTPFSAADKREYADLLDLGHLDVLVGSVGSGGSLCGTARALLPDLPDLRVVGVDCVGSVLFAQADWPQRRQSGLGNSLQPDNIDYAVIDEVHWLCDDEAFDATRALAREQKIFGGNTSGSVYRVLCYLAARAAPGSTLVGIFPDRGDRYVGSVYRGELGPVSAEPAEVRYGTAVSSWSKASIPRGRRPKLIFVESNTSGTGMLALRVAARLGTAPVLLTGRPDRYAGLSGIRCEIVECDTNDQAVLREAVRRQASGGAELAGITTTSEFYLAHAAELGGEFGRPANPVQACLTCRDKTRTRQALAAAGVRQPAFAVIRNPAEVAAAVAAIGLPCVLKPADDSGSNLVLLCGSEREAVMHAEEMLAVTTNVRGQRAAGTALVEEYLPGCELSVEMFSVAGTATCVGITRKTVAGLPHFVEIGHVFPAGLSDDVAAEVTGTVERALAAARWEFGASHVEVKLTPAGPAIVEINARLAGGMIPELVRLATGIDLLEQQLRAFAGLPVRLKAARARHAGIRFIVAPRAGTLVEVAGTAKARGASGVDSVVVTMAEGSWVRPARNAYDRLGYLIAVGDSVPEVDAALDAAYDHIEVIVAEDPGLSEPGR